MYTDIKLSWVHSQKISVMVFSTDDNKAVVCAGVPSEVENQESVAKEWLVAALEPLKGKGGGGKAGIARGHVSSSLVNLHSKFL